MYAIRVDAEHGVMVTTLAGMLTVAEADDYIAEIRRLFLYHKLRDYAFISDVSGCLIQSQDVIRTLAAHIATMPKARAIAVVTGSSLARMQIRRLFTQSYARILPTMEEARAWIYTGAEPAAA